MTPRTFRFLAAIGVFLLGGAAPGESQAPAPSAESLLGEMAKAYAALKSYSDESTAVYHNRDGSERLSVSFRIWFQRPANFRVDARSTAPGAAVPRREVLWSNGATTRTWATDKAVASHPKVQLAGSGMFGTYAYHIPTLLEPNYASGQRLNDLTSVQVVGEEQVEGVACHHLRGQWKGDAYQVWLGQTDHLVRKIVAGYADHEMEEIHRAIVLDQVIPPEVFQFAPENEKLPAKR
jgi:outer membrane lipoprotein-sorting protein